MFNSYKILWNYNVIKWLPYWYFVSSQKFFVDSRFERKQVYVMVNHKFVNFLQTDQFHVHKIWCFQTPSDTKTSETSRYHGLIFELGMSGNIFTKKMDFLCTYIRGFTKFGIKVLWMLNLDSQQGRLRTASILVRAFWNFKLKVLKYFTIPWYLEVWKILNHLTYMVIFGPKYKILTKVLIGLDLGTFLYSMKNWKWHRYLMDGKYHVKKRFLMYETMFKIKCLRSS